MTADFDAVVEMGGDFPCRRGAFALFDLDHSANAVATRAFEWATPSDRSRRRAFGVTAGYDRVS
jgi:hypothetical protein